MKSLYGFVVLGLSSLLSGCAANLQVITSAQAVEGAFGNTFVLAPASSGTDIASAEFQTYKRQAVRALELRGFREVRSIREADLGIRLGYAIGDPLSYSYYSPIVKKTGQVPYFHAGGHGMTHGSRDVYRVVGATAHPKTAYARYAVLQAFDLTTGLDGANFREVWRTTMMSVGSNDDLSRVFPALMAAGSSYFGMRTPQVVANISESDEVLRRIKGDN